MNADFKYGLAPVHQFGELLTTPSHHFGDELVRVTDPMIPGRYQEMQQLESPAEEVAYRVMMLVVGLFFYILLLPLYIVGEGTKIGCSALAKKPFALITDPSRLPAPQRQYSFLTYNVAAMPSLIRPVNGTRPVEVRMREIVAYIRLNHSEVTTLSFQECFTDEAQTLLITGLRDFFPHVVHHVGQNTVGLNSGLLFLSKMPITAVDFKPYPNRRGQNQFTQKGCVVVTQQGNGMKLVVSNTHMEAGGFLSSGAGKRRPAQFAFVEEIIKQAAKTDTNLVIFTSPSGRRPLSLGRG